MNKVNQKVSRKIQGKPQGIIRSLKETCKNPPKQFEFAAKKRPASHYTSTNLFLSILFLDLIPNYGNHTIPYAGNVEMAKKYSKI